MKTIEQKRLAVLEDTCSYFNTTTRNATGVNICSYFPQHDNTEGCAVGRLITDKELCKQLDGEPVGSVSHEAIFNQLPSDVQELGKGFLTRLQSLHDTQAVWGDTGLTEYGDTVKESIINQYC